MRKLIVLGAVMLLGAAAHAGDLSLDDVVDKYYEAAGSPAAWAQIETVRAQGQIGGGMDGSFVMSFERPLRFHSEFTVQGMTGEQGYDGEQGWIFLPFMGMTEARPAPPAAADAFREQADFEGPLVGWEEKGHQATLASEIEIEGKEVYELEVVLKGGGTVTYFLDAESFLAVKRTTTAETGETQMETTFEDYREVAGVRIPHVIGTRQGGAPAAQVFTIESLEVNVDLPDELFAMPQASEDSTDQLDHSDQAPSTEDG